MSIPSKNNQNQSWDLLSLYMMVVFENCGYNITVEKEKTLLKNKYSIRKLFILGEFSGSTSRVFHQSCRCLVEVSSIKQYLLLLFLFNSRETGENTKYIVLIISLNLCCKKYLIIFLWKTLEVIEFLMNSFFCSQSLNWRLKGMLAWWFGYSVIIFLTYHSHTNKLYDELSWNRNCQTGKN